MVCWTVWDGIGRPDSGLVAGRDGSASTGKADGCTDPFATRGPRSGCDTTGRVMSGRGASDDLNRAERTLCTVGTEVQALRQEVAKEFIVLDGLSVALGGVVGLAERVTAAREQSSPAAVGQEPIVPDAHEPSREDVEQEPATELTER